MEMSLGVSLLRTAQSLLTGRTIQNCYFRHFYKKNEESSSKYVESHFNNIFDETLINNWN